MSDFALNDSGDLSISTGDLTVIRDTTNDPAAIAQRLRIKLRTFQGEWFLDRMCGVPYFQYILGAKVTNPVLTTLSAIFTRAILETPGIKELTKPITFAIEKNTRITAIQFACKTVNGSIIESTEVF